jgi:hypothetical protein
LLWAVFWGPLLSGPEKQPSLVAQSSRQPSGLRDISVSYSVNPSARQVHGQLPDQEQDNVTPSYHREGDAVIFDRPAEQGEASRQRREDEQHEFARSQVKTNTRLAWFTGALMVATFCTIGVSIWQACIYGSQLGVMQRQLDQMSMQLPEMQKSAKAAQDSATAAQKAIQVAQGQMRVDQRAWLRVDLGESLFQWRIGQPITVKTKVLNTGKTLALNVSERVKVELLPVDKLPDFIYGNGHHACSAATGFVFPGETNPPTHSCSMFDPGTPIREHLLTAADTAQPNKFFIAIHGQIDYDDAFGIHHWLRFCGMSFLDNKIVRNKSDKGTEACKADQKTDQNLE